MHWKERLLRSVGPGVLGGITFRQWCGLLRREHLDPSCLPRAFAITLQSLKNSAVHRYEQHRYASVVERVTIAPPLFVLGHWRSGTTHLHQLLAQDPRFAFPNGYQATFPHTFLTAEPIDSWWMPFFVPKRRPMDNMEWSLGSPQEDEFALCVFSLKSPCMGWVFPRRREHYGRYLSFRNVSTDELAEWRAGFELFLQKLTWKYRRPLILKSPPHTCRIRLLLEMFPGARFVHIHRNPYTVFQSTRKMLETMVGWHNLQSARLDDLDDWILKQYREMYDLFFQERGLIPSGSYYEMDFEDLDKDPLDEMRRLYEALDLPDFRSVESGLERYIRSIRSYRKNEFPALEPGLKERIKSMCEPTIDEWGYGE